MLIIRRENWKGKYKIVARENGVLRANIKWGKGNHMDRLRNLFKTNGTFDPDITKTRTASGHLFEVFDSRVTTIKGKRINKTKKKGERFQYVISATVNGKTVTSRSGQYDNSYSSKSAREEAYNNLIMGLSSEINGFTDEKDGIRLYRRASKIKEGIVFYKRA